MVQNTSKNKLTKRTCVRCGWAPSVWVCDVQLSGPLPDSLGELSQLTILRLDNNLFSGPIPPSLGHLNNVEELVYLPS